MPRPEAMYHPTDLHLRREDLYGRHVRTSNRGWQTSLDAISVGVTTALKSQSTTLCQRLRRNTMRRRQEWVYGLFGRQRAGEVWLEVRRGKGQSHFDICHETQLTNAKIKIFKTIQLSWAINWANIKWLLHFLFVYCIEMCISNWKDVQHILPLFTA